MKLTIKDFEMIDKSEVEGQLLWSKRYQSKQIPGNSNQQNKARAIEEALIKLKLEILVALEAKMKKQGETKVDAYKIEHPSKLFSVSSSMVRKPGMMPLESILVTANFRIVKKKTKKTTKKEESK